MSFDCGIPLPLSVCICINIYRPMWKWVWLFGSVSHPSHNFLFFPVIALLFQNKYETFVVHLFDRNIHWNSQWCFLFGHTVCLSPEDEWFGTFDDTVPPPPKKKSLDSRLESSIATGAFGIPTAQIVYSAGSDVYYFYKPDGLCRMRRFAS